MKSKSIDIKRGVRQGDPMLCLLYNLAIEPLVIMIRQSKLKGLKIKGEAERLITTLFADDTLVYMNKKDNIKKLYKIREIFCTASTVKFNIEKTEILPMGKKEYRKKVIDTRKLNDKQTTPFEESVRIVKDGETMKTLEAWIGNKSTVDSQWNTILEKQKKVIDVWQKSRPSYKGKEMISKALVMSLGNFFATVNGMPEWVQLKMQKQIANFLWDDRKKGYLPWKKIIAPRKRGGLNMP